MLTRLLSAAAAALALLVSTIPAQAAVAPTVTLTVTPASGVESVTPTLTWSTTGAVSCTAGGGWSGIKATSGSQTLPAITAGATYTLTCLGAAAPGSASLSWTAPTSNTDGSALTDLAGFNIYRDGAKIGSAGATTLTYSDTGLADGTYSYTVTAQNAAGVESKPSNPAPKTISGTAAASATASASVKVDTRPNPPTMVTVASTAYAPRLFRSQFVMLAIGTVPLGTACDPMIRVAGLNRIPTAAVRPPQHAGYFFGKCA